MAAEYSFIPIQTVADDESILFFEGERACKKGYVIHRNTSGLFKLRGARNCQKAIYKVEFNANIAVPTGGTVGEIAVAMSEDGETALNTLSRVTPAAVDEYFTVSFSTYVIIPCGCCVTIAIKNVSTTGTDINVQNANIIIDRVA